MGNVAKVRAPNKECAQGRAHGQSCLAMFEREERQEQPISSVMPRAADCSGLEDASTLVAPAPVLRDGFAEISIDTLRELVGLLDAIPSYLITAWDEIEELADEANAGSWLAEPGHRQKDDDVFDHVEDHRRPAVKNIRFTLANVEEVRKRLRDYALYGMPKAERAESPARTAHNGRGGQS